MTVSETMSSPRVDQVRGVSGEFHTTGLLVYAADVAVRRGFRRHNMWFIGDPTVDRVGEPSGFVLPVSYVREGTVGGVVLGLLFGLVCAFTLPQPAPFGEAVARLVPYLLTGVVLGVTVCGGLAWLAVRGRMKGYLASATGGGLRLKIAVPDGVPEAEQERLAELALMALREAKAEAITHLDGTREVNSPQQTTYIP